MFLSVKWLVVSEFQDGLARGVCHQVLKLITGKERGYHDPVTGVCQCDPGYDGETWSKTCPVCENFTPL